MELKFTNELPKKEGYYWWTNFGEHTPTIVEVVREGDGWFAQNEEFCFPVQKLNRKKIIKECVSSELGPNEDGYYYGEELWCYIPNPILPNGKQVTPDCY